MLIQLNPRLPLVWRTPDTIQVGIDRPVVVVTGVTVALEAVITGLRAGVPLSGALLLGREAGASAAAVTRLIEQLAPALVDHSTPGTGASGTSAARPTVIVDGVGPTAERLGGLLQELGLVDASAALPANTQPSLAVLIGHYVLQPDRHTHWLRRDVPHLPVIYGDAGVRIGPLVQPGSGPCLVCVELEHVDLDPAWPALACQLVRRAAATETPRLSIEVAARVAVLAHDLLGNEAEHPASLLGGSVVIDAATGEVRRRVHLAHARCACRALPENETVPGPIAAGFRPSTSSDRAASWHG
ncbi:bacteriocin biosynthesis cyclodehydratase domain-containing protein [Cryobacterium psychrophilum]|uniref:TOMM leader peptide-binding protein n=1 Tax=Cryobacterium psychrophilum TaxID=41988 RepID=A0A4Y8KPU6_9MICO|nr:bacteriocin biosynthesis cyclodehydratase domain-containing protein [Cryobacterium psychrophilum]TFD80800.1 TOMM precursor leader peptide-binding protein [Cryobacterium psychrophilum]